jgi:microcystin-dependent protein
MAQPYVGEIRMFAGNFAPAGWAFCAGQEMPISENETLYQLIGTTYGGDGQEFFKLPDLRGRVPVHAGNGITLAQQGGVESVTLTTQQIPNHSHAMLASTGAPNTTDPQNAILARSIASIYNSGTSPTPMRTDVIATVGGSQPHNNLQPYVCVSFIISLFGIFPNPT